MAMKNAILVLTVMLLTGPAYASDEGAPFPSYGVMLDSHWSSPFPQLSGRVMATATHDGKLYVGGYFRTAGGTTVNHVAMWDGKQWRPLGTGTDQPVLALALDDEGNLYAGGVFSSAGDVQAASVARWDGSRWSDLGRGMNSTVYSLALDEEGMLYAGGSFSRAGDADAQRIARWDGRRWDPMGAGMDHHVFAIAPAGGDTIYAAGGFMMAGGRSADQVAMWDGDAWWPLGTGLKPAMDGYPATSLALGPGGKPVYVGGSFATAGGREIPYLAKWDGGRWSAVGGGVDGPVRALLMDDDGTLYVGGYFTRAGNVDAPFIAGWNDGNWRPLENGTSGPVFVIHRDESMLHVGGDFRSAGPTSAGNLACWQTSISTSAERGPVRQHAAMSSGPVFPNPVESTASIPFTLSASADVTLTVYDVMGRERLFVVDGRRLAGPNVATVDASHLPGGLYLYELNTGLRTYTGRFVVQR
ncbi:MAG: T9SS type A sorting domain-containing protein [Rhodothermales bacterium]